MNHSGNHDADDLNDYLDQLVAGSHTPPADDVQSAAAHLQSLANHPSSELRQQEGIPMNTVTIFHPYPQRHRRTDAPGWSAVASAAIVAAMLLSLIGYAWTRVAPERQEPPNLSHLPAGMAPAHIDALNSKSSPWIADFSPEDCSERTDLTEVVVDYDAMPKSDPQSYAITGDAEPDDANSAADQYRAMRACANMSSAWAYWTDARINQHTRVLDETSMIELADMQSHFASVYPEQFMAIGNDLEVNPKIWAEWAARTDHNVIGQPIPLAAKLNPDWAVTLADGRIAFPMTVMYSSIDPAIYLGGLPVDDPVSTVVIVFANVDGTWKYDDSLALCLEDCTSGMGNPLDPQVNTWIQFADQRACTAQSLIPELDYDLSDGFPNYEGREYQMAEIAPEAVASAAAKTANDWYGCTLIDSDSRESLSYLTPLGTANFVLVEQGSFGDPVEIAPYLREREVGTANLISSVPGWAQVAVIDSPIQYKQSNMTWTPMFDGSAENTASVRTQEGGFNPATAVTLGDGRVAVGHTPAISVNDRGAITYEGNAIMNAQFGVIMQQHGDLWLVDDLLVAQNGALAFTQSDGWWWDTRFDPPAAPGPEENLAVAIDDDSMPLDPASAPWIADFSPDTCEGEPQSIVELANRARDAEPGEQSYDIVGPAAPDDTTKVGAAYQAMRGCEDDTAAATYWSDARIAVTPRNLTDANLSELAALQEHFQSVYPDQFMVTAVDVAVSDEIQAEWDARAEFDVLGAPIPLSVKINPEWGMELGDGRIAFPATVVYAANDPAIVANGLPVDSPASTVAMVFTYENDGWKYDDSLPLCLANCEFGIGNPLDPAVETWSVPPTIAECTAPLTDWETIQERMSADIDWTAGSTTIQGAAAKADAEAALANYRIVDACNRYSLTEGLTLYSDLGLQFYGPIQRGPAPQLLEQKEKMRQASLQSDLLHMEILAHEPRISTVAVSRSYLGRYEIPGTTSMQLQVSDRDAFSSFDHMATADGALILEDGRIVLPLVRVIDMNDRGAIVYGGGIHDQGTAAVLSNVDGEWKVDYYMMLFGPSELPDFSIVPRTNTWWDMTPTTTPTSGNNSSSSNEIPSGGDNGPSPTPKT